ncbi:MAG: DUF1318 domain-containing protein [Micavibrio aeruginosavorus]|uniref:DUF1318 domain-containing protein n=1 Tax=Micavibrio aeruginosavorus TaxID=349221 RepID=A0A2W5FGL5_9BACT|nr:MAG: DUF1318 domain-containing protein [Micavibrio aeruginosavorus]
MKKILILTLALTMLMPIAAFAMDLSSAKQAGYVGEKPDGLVGAVASPSAEVQALIAETNAGRLAVYTDTAAKQGVPVSQVQALAAEKLYGMASGQYVMINGSWVKK